MLKQEDSKGLELCFKALEGALMGYERIFRTSGDCLRTSRAGVDCLRTSSGSGDGLRNSRCNGGLFKNLQGQW